MHRSFIPYPFAVIFYFSTDTISVDVQKQIKEITQAQVNNNKYSHSILRGYENNSWQADL